MSLAKFFYYQLFVKHPYPNHDFSGQTVIVTGANVGLGLEAVRHFVRLNAEKVILAVRNLDKGQAAKRDLESTRGSSKTALEVWQVDFANYASVKAFAARVNKDLPRLDVLVENAGLSTRKFQIAEDSESTITVNVISTFLLGLLLLPKLRETATKFKITPHLVIVNSEVHFWSKFTERKYSSILDAVADEKKSNQPDRYNTSKLLGVLYIKALLPHLDASNKPHVILNYLTPGLCHSELGREMGSWFTLFKNLFARSTEEGSRSLIAAAAGGEETHGQFMWACVPAAPSSFVTSQEGKDHGERLYRELNAKLEGISPGVTGNI